jgi:hypothetical protein
MASAGDDKEKIRSDDKLPKEEEYICEICMERVNDANQLDEHRATKHKASTGE